MFLRLPRLTRPLSIALVLLAAASGRLVSEPTPAATSAFNAYIARLETRLDQQHHSAAQFLAHSDPQSLDRLHHGEILVDELSQGDPLSSTGALLHHWRGTAFVPGASADSFETLLRNFSQYPQVFAPQVLRARVQPGAGDHLSATMRVRQKHVLTVVLDTDYDVVFSRLLPGLRFSASRSTRVAEIDSAGTASEHALSPTDDHGFLWRINTYWSWQERDNGLMIQIESVSLTRSIPTGLGWAVRPFVESVPRESLDFTLRSAIKALQPH